MGKDGDNKEAHKKWDGYAGKSEFSSGPNVNLYSFPMHRHILKIKHGYIHGQKGVMVKRQTLGEMLVKFCIFAFNQTFTLYLLERKEIDLCRM